MSRENLPHKEHTKSVAANYDLVNQSPLHRDILLKSVYFFVASNDPMIFLEAFQLS